MGRSVVGQPREAQVAPVTRARSGTNLIAGHALPTLGVKRPTARRAGPRHAGLPDASADRGRPESCARAYGASRGLSHPHDAERLTTSGTRPRPLAVRRPYALAATRYSVARGARLTVASCFHTLVSPIRRAAVGRSEWPTAPLAQTESEAAALAIRVGALDVEHLQAAALAGRQRSTTWPGWRAARRSAT